MTAFSKTPFIILYLETIIFKYKTSYSGKLQTWKDNSSFPCQTQKRENAMEESLCNIEFLKKASTYLARVQSELGGLREYRSNTFEEVLEQVIIDLQEEFESSG